ncbi:MAG: PQQ-binding-like beta-propeller repeat protein [Methylocella sp.]
MRFGISAAKTAFSLFVLVSGNLHAQEGRPINAEEDWPMYGRNLRHTFSNEHSRINPSNVSSLQLAWTFTTGDAVSASPTVADGVVYVGSWDGYFYALDAHSGSLIWKFQVDCQNSIVPVPPHCLPPGTPPPPRALTDGGLITSSAAVVAGHVHFAAGKTLYSLNARDGKLSWKRVICGNPDELNCTADAQDPNRIFSSPAIFDDLIFVGHTVDGVNGYRGGFEAVDAATGELRWRFEVDPKLNIQGQVVGAYNRGCGGVWSSAAVDTKDRLVFFGTADCNFDATPPYHEAVIALESKTGQLRWVFRPRKTDTCDFDFGASPNIIDLANSRNLGIGGKDGTYYLLDRLTGRVVWARNVVFGGFVGGFYGGAAFDGQHIFSATGIGDDGNPLTKTGLCSSDLNPLNVFEEPSIHALNADNGSIRWEERQNHSFAATSLSDGVVFSGLVGPIPIIEPPALKAYDARSGALLKTFPMAGSVNSAATPVGKMLFVTSGNSFDGKGSGVHAFTLR